MSCREYANQSHRLTSNEDFDYQLSDDLLDELYLDLQTFNLQLETLELNNSYEDSDIVVYGNPFENDLPS